MANQDPNFLQKITLGIILRGSTAVNGRYAYIPLPRTLPYSIPKSISTNLDQSLANSLANAPHFPNITIHDVVNTNILYEANTYPNYYHIYNLINHTHLSFSFPHHLTFIAASIVIHDSSHFKVLFICINQHPNPLFTEEGDHNPKHLVFYVYASHSRDWSLVPIDQPLTSDNLLSNRRKPIHPIESIVYHDLTDRFLVCFSTVEDRIHLIPKKESKRERHTSSVDEEVRYGACRRQLFCVKLNPIKARVDAYLWTFREGGSWRKVVKGKRGSMRRRVLGIHPDEKTFVFMRSSNDEISIIDIEQDFPFVIIQGRGAQCGPACFLHGMVDVLNVTLLGFDAKHSFCGVFHPHENIDGPEGEFFAVSLLGTPLILST